MNHRSSRRHFLQQALAAGAASFSMRPIGATEPSVSPATRSANEKLQLAMIGVAGRGATNLQLLAMQPDISIVGLCDVDESRLREAAERYPDASRFFDCREMIATMDGLDGIVISTPDHMHAIPAVLALRRRMPVYCEKPLTHSVQEARLLRELSMSAGVATQMGNQLHRCPNFRRVTEIIGSGAIGPVNRVHVWVGGETPAGKRVAQANPPKGIHYDLWLGPAPERPYHESHFHFFWRYWWDFGNGQLGDLGCHYLDLPCAALNLNFPTVIAARGEKAHDGDNDCPGRMQVDYQFPAAGDRPAVQLTWYHGGWKPPGAEVYERNSAVLFEGPDGRLLADLRTSNLFLNSGKDSALLTAAPPEPDGPHREWLAAIRGAGKTSSDFDSAGRLTETVLLGNVAYRANSSLEWNPQTLTAVNCAAADPFLRREYRPGWEL
ncbi:MAG: Gfo/Idh/MocA family oxidoreductase [Planctomycetaceae bacterium]